MDGVVSIEKFSWVKDVAFEISAFLAINILSSLLSLACVVVPVPKRPNIKRGAKVEDDSICAISEYQLGSTDILMLPYRLF